MVLQRYRVFTAMLDLGEFTVEGLAAASGTNANTVLKTLSRNGHLVEGIGRAETGRRGGRWPRYRLLPEGADELRERLSEVERLRTAKWFSGPPSEFLAAEKLLLDIASQEIDPDVRKSQVRRARRLLDAGRKTVDAWPQEAEPERYSEAKTHEFAVDLLLRLTEVEDAGGDATIAVERWDAIRAEFDRHQTSL